MYEQDDDYVHGGPGGALGDDEEEDNNEEIPNEIWQEACWIVISAYFEEKGEILLTLIHFIRRKMKRKL